MKKVLIIGLGNIGFKYDLNLNKDHYIYTHSRAFNSSSLFDVVGAVETDPKVRKKFSEIYPIETFTSLEEASNNIDVDLVVIAVPTHSHLSTVKEALTYFNPEAILLEKPISYELDKSIEITEICANNNVDLFVNFYRRSDPGVVGIKKMIEGKLLNKPFRGVCWYSKGFLHNGSHFINILEYWFGKIQDSKITNVNRLEKDFALDVHLFFKELNIFFMHFEDESYTHHSLEVFTAEGRLSSHQGRDFYFNKSDNVLDLPGYRILNDQKIDMNSDMNKYQYNVILQLENYFKKSSFDLCSGKEALGNQLSMNKIIENI